ncbi:MAG: hypothetical protein A3E01_00320 [Gammaproteobacteria bacterium RIFCSPHIGHO2_12_FULL_63_22]|nr:MAG: hypothetical protein A3E01_00320 [Gammaproteobacteria bacterium RIFCSPHIGHO2_12_FULL_63_22]
MAIDRSTFITEIKNDLEEYGEWSTEVGGRLDIALLYAMKDFSEKRDWSFMFSSGSLVVTEGNQGPYDPPAGFDSLVTPEVIARYYDYDRFSVPPSIPDATNGTKYDVLWDRLNNKLYLRETAAAGTYTFYFRRTFTATSDLSDWPDAARRYLGFQAMHYAMVKSEDLAAQADRMFQRADVAYKSMLQNLRRGESKQESREPRDVYGYPLAQSYANDGDGFLGGR